MMGMTNKQIVSKIAQMCGEFHDVKVATIMNRWPESTRKPIQDIVYAAEQLLYDIRHKLKIDDEPENE